MSISISSTTQQTEERSAVPPSPPALTTWRADDGRRLEANGDARQGRAGPSPADPLGGSAHFLVEVWSLGGGSHGAGAMQELERSGTIRPSVMYVPRIYSPPGGSPFVVVSGMRSGTCFTVAQMRDSSGRCNEPQFADWPVLTLAFLERLRWGASRWWQRGRSTATQTTRRTHTCVSHDAAHSVALRPMAGTPFELSCFLDPIVSPLTRLVEAGLTAGSALLGGLSSTAAATHPSTSLSTILPAGVSGLNRIREKLRASNRELLHGS
jgi:hypothetical protein